MWIGSLKIQSMITPTIRRRKRDIKHMIIAKVIDGKTEVSKEFLESIQILKIY